MKDSTFSNLAVVIERNVMVPMRDGVRLSTDIYRPRQEAGEDPKPLPVIMERTPYGKHLESRTEREPGSARPRSREEVATYFVAQGYIVVYQDCRGRYGSEGTFTKYLSEANDGHDTCDWIVRQPWSDGRIGTKGLSYAAHTQMALASTGAPGLLAMYVDSGGFSNGYQSGIRQGGAYELKQAAWAVLFASSIAQRSENTAVASTLKNIDVDDWFKRMPWRRGNSPLSEAPEYEEFLFDQWERGTFDAYWKQPGIYAEGFYHHLKNVATVHMSSWYDVYTRTAAENYGSLKKIGAPVKLVFGPWVHGNRWLTYSGDVDFGEKSTFGHHVATSFLEARLKWFDHWLKGLPAAEDNANVRLFVMGGGSGRKNSEGRLDHGGTWRSEQDWPIPDTQWKPYHLHVDRSLSPSLPERHHGALAYRFDPKNPVPTLGGSVVSRPPGILAGAFDQTTDERFFGCAEPFYPLTDREDVLAFSTEPLVEDVEITGPVVANLWISSDCPDTDFTIKLVDVYPQSEDYPKGFAMNLTDGILRVRYRDSWERPELMTPGTVYPIRIEAFPTSNLFKAGHRIRVDISSSNFPHFDVNPNTGDPEAQATTSRTALNKVYMNSQHPSHVVLPVIPTRSQ